MRLFTYICFCLSLFVFSSEQETLEANKEGKFLSASELEALKALIPEELRYEVPEIPNNSFLDLQEFLKEKDVPRFSNQERQTIQNI
ncbi:hypothetical protein PQO01_01765 [Lentisphaera marina]|uniref:hypothetical protein n=1 Tax=Lentisphaera marina TaxID=1111041 RepID=UPI0023663B0D|nr:hypothetical protein [Lentisphaera marina]MDD7983675.1 hypothetical protein [Lentisphaera marina]